MCLHTQPEQKDNLLRDNSSPTKLKKQRQTHTPPYKIPYPNAVRSGGLFKAEESNEISTALYQQAAPLTVVLFRADEYWAIRADDRLIRLFSRVPPIFFFCSRSCALPLLHPTPPRLCPRPFAFRPGAWPSHPSECSWRQDNHGRCVALGCHERPGRTPHFSDTFVGVRALGSEVWNHYHRSPAARGIVLIPTVRCALLVGLRVFSQQQQQQRQQLGCDRCMYIKAIRPTPTLVLSKSDKISNKQVVKRLLVWLLTSFFTVYISIRTRRYIIPL